MNNITFDIRKQAFLMLMMLSFLAIGLKTLVIALLQSWLTVPQSFDLLPPEGLALTLVGIALAAHVLFLNGRFRSISALALIAFGGYSLIYHGWRALHNQADGLASGFYLPLIPAMLITLMGLCCSLGANEKTCLLWRICSALSIIFGGLSLVDDLALLNTEGVLAVPATQASITGGFFALLLGGDFLGDRYPAGKSPLFYAGSGGQNRQLRFPRNFSTFVCYHDDSTAGA